MIYKKDYIISYPDFEKILEENDKNALFSQMEIDLYGDKKSTGSLSGRYMLKIALEKFLESKLVFNEIEILNDVSGKPFLKYSRNIENMITAKKVVSIEVSISHSKNRAVGLFVAEIIRSPLNYGK